MDVFPTFIVAWYSRNAHFHPFNSKKDMFTYFYWFLIIYLLTYVALKNIQVKQVSGILCTNEMSSNKSSFSRYLPFFWPVRQSRAAVEPNLSLSRNTLISWYAYCYTWICIWRCVNSVTVFKFLVYWVNNTRCPLLYVISLCFVQYKAYI